PRLQQLELFLRALEGVLEAAHLPIDLFGRNSGAQHDPVIAVEAKRRADRDTRRNTGPLEGSLRPVQLSSPNLPRKRASIASVASRSSSPETSSTSSVPGRAASIKTPRMLRPSAAAASPWRESDTELEKVAASRTSLAAARA